MKLIIRAFDLPLKHTFTIAYASRDVQDTLIVELQQEGFRSFDEATANPYYGISIQSMTEALKKTRNQIENTVLEDPKTF